MKPGDLLVSLDGDTLRLDSAEQVELGTTVFNFEVCGLHNYFVGDDQVLVQNVNLDCDKLGPYDYLTGQGLYVLMDGNNTIR